MPHELSERRKQMISMYKKAREQNRPVKCVCEKLMMNNNIHEVHQDTVNDINIDTTDLATSIHVVRTPPKYYKGSTFQGSVIPTTSTDDVRPGLHAVYSDLCCARAAHNTYAYRLRTSNGDIFEHYYDDGEFGAGRKLINLMKEKDTINSIICVTQWSGGTHLGPSRFAHIIEAARNVLNLS